MKIKNMEEFDLLTDLLNKHIAINKLLLKANRVYVSFFNLLIKEEANSDEVSSQFEKVIEYSNKMQPRIKIDLEKVKKSGRELLNCDK